MEGMNLIQNPEKFEWVIPCPICADWRTVSWKQLKFERNKPLVLDFRYECDKCGCVITDDSDKLKRLGRWRSNLDLDKNTQQKIAEDRSFVGNE